MTSVNSPQTSQAQREGLSDSAELSAVSPRRTSASTPPSRIAAPASQAAIDGHREPVASDVTAHPGAASGGSPYVANKFQNDGSFLANFLSQQAAEHKKRPSPLVTAVPGKKHKGLEKKRSDKLGGHQRPSKKSEGPPAPLPQDEDLDEAAAQAKAEFLRVMRVMEEAGLVTEKGIGAGMVK